MLNCSPACERNKAPILDHLLEVFADAGAVLEIGSGTGQHAVHFARHMPWLRWQPADRAEWLPGLRERIAAEGPPNLLAPLEFDVRDADWPLAGMDAVFSANTLHIMSWPCVEAFFRGLARGLAGGARVAVYGPFAYDGRHTSASNAAFDQRLRSEDPHSGIRDFTAVNALAGAADLMLLADHALPANNRLLVWERASTAGAAAHPQ